MSLKKLELKKRRRQLFILYNSGFPLADIVSKLSEKFGVAEKTIYGDYESKNEWRDEVFDVEDLQILIDDLVAAKKILKMEAWKVYRNADQSAARIGALKLVNDIETTMIELLQSTGKTEKVPDIIEHDLGPIMEKILRDNELKDAYKKILRAYKRNTDSRAGDESEAGKE